MTGRASRSQGPKHGTTPSSLRSGRNACALVRAGAIVLTNAAFERLERRTSAVGAVGWRLVPTRDGHQAAREPARSHPSLKELVLAEIRRVKGEPLEGWCARYGNGTNVVEMTLARPARSRPRPEVLAVLRDVTALASLEVKGPPSPQHLLRQAQVRAMGELAAGVAHDVSNILGALQLRVEVLARDPKCQTSQGHNIEALGRIVRDAQTLVSKLRAFTCPEQCEMGAVDLHQVVADAVEIATSGLQLRSACASGHLTIDARLPAALPLVRGAAGDLRHVFMNLLINARDAMPAGGVVMIRGEALANHVVVRVEDEGPGIPAPMLERIFNSFFTTKGSHGCGLGLSLARGVMEGIGGSIVARNRPEGGACFELRFCRYRALAASGTTFARPTFQASV